MGWSKPGTRSREDFGLKRLSSIESMRTAGERRKGNRERGQLRGRGFCRKDTFSRRPNADRREDAGGINRGQTGR